MALLLVSLRFWLRRAHFAAASAYASSAPGLVFCLTLRQVIAFSPFLSILLCVPGRAWRSFGLAFHFIMTKYDNCLLQQTPNS